MAKYIVYADYIVTKVVGTVEADSSEEAVQNFSICQHLMKRLAYTHNWMNDHFRYVKSTRIDCKIQKGLV